MKTSLSDLTCKAYLPSASVKSAPKDSPLKASKTSTLANWRAKPSSSSTKTSTVPSAICMVTVNSVSSAFRLSKYSASLQPEFSRLKAKAL